MILQCAAEFFLSEIPHATKTSFDALRVGADVGSFHPPYLSWLKMNPCVDAF
jgi:hypothetical protein